MEITKQLHLLTLVIMVSASKVSASLSSKHIQCDIEGKILTKTGIEEILGTKLPEAVVKCIRCVCKDGNIQCDWRSINCKEEPPTLQNQKYSPHSGIKDDKLASVPPSTTSPTTTTTSTSPEVETVNSNSDSLSQSSTPLPRFRGGYIFTVNPTPIWNLNTPEDTSPAYADERPDNELWDDGSEESSEMEKLTTQSTTVETPAKPILLPRLMSRPTTTATSTTIRTTTLTGEKFTTSTTSSPTSSIATNSETTPTYPNDNSDAETESNQRQTTRSLIRPYTRQEPTEPTVPAIKPKKVNHHLMIGNTIELDEPRVSPSTLLSDTRFQDFMIPYIMIPIYVIAICLVALVMQGLIWLCKNHKQSKQMSKSQIQGLNLGRGHTGMITNFDLPFDIYGNQI